MCVRGVDDDHDDHADDDVVVLDHVDAGDDHHHHGADDDDHDVDHDDDNALRFAQPGVHAAINGPARLSACPGGLTETALTSPASAPGAILRMVQRSLQRAGAVVRDAVLAIPRDDEDLTLARTGKRCVVYLDD